MTGDREALLPIQLWPRTSDIPDITAFTASVGGKVVADLFVTRGPGDPEPLRVSFPVTEVTELEMLERQQEQRSSSSSFQPRHPPRTELAPFTRLDSVVAHEFWHQIEFGLESGRYRDSVELRRAVGRYFGVETLEHAIKGARPDAPLEWQVARVRLAEEVSGYATTAPKEATAEMFAQWWCTTSAPPPSAQFFGQLLRQFFPAADLDR